MRGAPKQLSLCAYVLVIAGTIGCSDTRAGAGSASAAARARRSRAPAAAAESAPWILEKVRRGLRPDPKWAARPRIKADDRSGLRALPDGKLEEWADAKWIAPTTGGDAASAKLAFASYPGGLSLAIVVRDAHHHAAAAASALDKSDHVKLELWPLASGPRLKPEDATAKAALGVTLRLGTRNQLIAFDRPREAWREKAASATGVPQPGGGGYQIEARLPLKTLTPLRGATVAKLRYRVTVFDADKKGGAAVARQRFEGVAELKVPMHVPEAVQKRPSARVCMASEASALWGFRNAWRCVVPHGRRDVGADDRQAPSIAFAWGRYPKPPRLQWLREKLIFINMLGLGHGHAALLSKDEKILSLLRLGIVGNEDPGNARAHESGAEPIKLPDGTWAVVVVHAEPAKTGPMGARCAAGHRVYTSIIAARGAPESTPHKPAPEPATPPQLEEVFRVLLEDCSGRRAFDFDLSKDRRVVRVRNSLFPARDVSTFVYRDGFYRRLRGELAQRAR
ncbi:MAG: hypothetical protein KC503_08060 [Myxococcales bacterium]|nr:hypothetical protein [Myxococcales bacterium]